MKNRKDHNLDNTLSVFIFKPNIRGMQYGIGTYIRELTEALLENTSCKVYIVSYYANCTEFEVENLSSRNFNISIPAPKFLTERNDATDEKYASTVVRLLSNMIIKNENVVFQMNYVNDLNIIKKLKGKFNYPIVSVVHFALWHQFFNGNKNKIAHLNIDNPTNNIEYTISQEKLMYQLSDRIISVTGYMKYFLIEKYFIDYDKIFIIHNGINFENYKNISSEEKIKLKISLGFMPEEKIILFTGRVDNSKGIFFLLDTFKEICKQNFNLRLVIIGQGQIPECMDRIQSFFGKITFTGFLPPEKVKQFYQIADVGVVPSIYDHCPYTVLEMIANEIPLILSNIEGLNEILDDQKCIFLNPVIKEGEIMFDLIEFEDAILSLIGNEVLCKKLTNNSLQYLKEKHNAKKMAQEVVCAYTSFS